LLKTTTKVCLLGGKSFNMLYLQDLEMAEELMNSSVDVVDHVEAPLDQEQVPFV